MFGYYPVLLSLTKSVIDDARAKRARLMRGNCSGFLLT